MNNIFVCAASIACATLGCSLEVTDEPSREPVGTDAAEVRRFADFDVAFGDCVESIGVTLASTETVAALVPPEYLPVGTGTPVTPLVVRTASCESVSVDGQRGRPGRVVQIGAVIVPPDGTGDINNYTLHYYSDDSKLVEALGRAGMAVTKAHVAYADTDSSLDVTVKARGCSSLRLNGPVMPVSAPAGSFLANWWAATRYGTLKLSTTVPEIAIGSAALVLAVRAEGDLDELFGGTSVPFPILQQFNAFSAAAMHVSRGE
jgi:hypothetical protein